MKNKIDFPKIDNHALLQQKAFVSNTKIYGNKASAKGNSNSTNQPENDLAEVLFLTSYPPRECGIATYSQDLIKALNNKFSQSLSIKVCALESGKSNYLYPAEVKYTLNTSIEYEYEHLALTINNDRKVKIVLVQHEFGFFKSQEPAFMRFLYELAKPVIIVFHTVLPNPSELLKAKIRSIAAFGSIIVMTNNSAEILVNDYDFQPKQITVIAHGTHLVSHLSETFLKEKYGLQGRKVLSTFGLLSSGKSIETTIEALPEIVKQCPEVIFLVLGKTHPEVVKTEGEVYREKLEQMVELFNLQNNVKFINSYLALPKLLEYLQLTDIYLFTSNDPHQAVSGTFAYAMSCACPIISTPMPHAKELLTDDTGIIFDFRNSQQLAEAAIMLLNDDTLRKCISANALQKIVSTAWENSAVAHAMLLEKISSGKITIQYNLPEINLDHLHEMTTNFGIIQFSKLNQPDIESGYTLDDNSRALVAMCMHFKLMGNEKDLYYINKYVQFIGHCQQPTGNFLNYVDVDKQFTEQNKAVNLDDSTGRAVWALGYLVSLSGLIPAKIISDANTILQKAIPRLEKVHSTRAMAFAIKGLHYHQGTVNSPEHISLITVFANRLLEMYKHEASENWEWFEGYLTYANSILPEAMLYAWLTTGEKVYKDVAISSFDFLLSQIFNDNGIEVISNKHWLLKGQQAGHFGEQPIDVAYTVMTLSKFYDVFMKEDYYIKMRTAFNWFLGSNRLRQIIYNPCTGGCYDGLEEIHVNLNQGAESTVSYLMARFTVERYKQPHKNTTGKAHVSASKEINKKEELVKAETNKLKTKASRIFSTTFTGVTSVILL